ncbi:hypothetical protein GWG10_10300 [Aeromonas caviae]|uniref:hypothetical protein n=1 Tax=Aeromonas caviae TaxID=648 RepID=UPI0015DDC360|nr:hypothetical protein [Aeromonas caviae]QLL88585.1 hypothetical protein GWG10_10300 [Aeromonas caviae]
MTPTFTKKYGYNTFNTSSVIAQSPYLLDPDTKFNAEGDLKCNFTVEDNDYWRGVIERCESDLKEYAAQVHKDTGKKPRLSADLPWVENYDGTITFKTKRKAQITRKKDKKVIEITVPQFDAKCQPIMPMVEISGGSAINLNLEIYTWVVINRAGVFLRPLAVQVLDLYEKRGPRRDADEYGFGVVEGPVLLKPF